MVLAASHAWCWQGQTPLHMLPYGSDEDRQTPILGLLCSYSADFNAQDGEVSPCTCASFPRKVVQTYCNKTMLELQQSSVHFERFCNMFVQCDVSGLYLVVLNASFGLHLVLVACVQHHTDTSARHMIHDQSDSASCALIVLLLKCRDKYSRSMGLVNLSTSQQGFVLTG